ncbi:MAG TPA: hypothetical protein DHV15_12740 [Treponema sp.]|uniref:Uncharacterized protein n=1 Tax=Treponema denticola (strain ATCC 35405 / DSM 14222 / CIP 103919 / JCM 8153 / KCTC 15104) TaxID=243275 RepID=Q73NU5_TREDE|nr:hypothetical protein TDE_1057 [Treponema denticola ATCC 35405]HCY96352.1 hypothetical protein [Treponema sp.]
MRNCKLGEENPFFGERCFPPLCPLLSPKFRLGAPPLRTRIVIKFLV